MKSQAMVGIMAGLCMLLILGISIASGVAATPQGGPGSNALRGNGPPQDSTFVDDDWVGLPEGTPVQFPGRPQWHEIGVDAFATIQAAVDATLPDGTVNIAPGLYEEQVVVSGSGRNLIGAGSGDSPDTSTIVRSPETLTYNVFISSSYIYYPVVGFDECTGGSIQNVRVDGYGRGDANYRFVGISFWNAGGDVSNCFITGMHHTPVSAVSSGYGIFARNGTSGPYAINVVGTSVSDFQATAMYLLDNGLTANVSNCTVVGAGPTGVNIQHGIRLGYFATGSISGCAISDICFENPSYASGGLYLYMTGTGVVLSQNDVQDCQEGLLISGATDVTVEQNAFTGCSRFGVYIRPSYGSVTDLTFTQNTIANNGECGVYLYPGTYELSNIVFRENDISGNTWAGMFNNDTTVVDAKDNWWGDITGPFHPMWNPGGLGNEVSDNVDFIPFLTSPPGGVCPDFYVSLRVRTKNSGNAIVQDGKNYAGMDNDANNGPAWDPAFDNPEPPLAPGGVSLFYAHDGFSCPPFTTFRTDFRDADSKDLSYDYEVWDVYVTNRGFASVDTIFMDYGENLDLPANYSVVLTNLEGTVARDLRYEQYYATVGPTDTVHLLLYIGTGVPHGRLHHFQVSSLSNQTAGIAFDLTITAKDSANNRVMDYAGTVHFSTTGGPSPREDWPVLPSDYTFFPGENGVHDFVGQFDLYKAEADRVITVEDVAEPTKTGSSNLFTVQPSDAANLWFSGGSGSQTAGAANGLELTAKDLFWNVCSSGSCNYTGDRSLVFGGANPSPAPCGSTPTVTDATAVPVEFGSPTTITFTDGVSTAGGSMVLYKLEGASITVYDYAAMYITEQSPLAVTVNPAGASYITVQTEASEGGAEAGAYTMTTDDSWTLYAADYDVFCNYRGLASAAWSRTGGISAPPAGPATSIIYAPSLSGCPNPTGTIVATVGDKSDATGTVKVGFGKAATVTITPSSWNQNVRTDQVVAGRGWDGDGNEICADTLAGALVWSLVDPGLPLRGPGGTIAPVPGTVTATYTAGSVPNVYTDAVQLTSDFKGGAPAAAKATPTVQMIPLVAGWNMVSVPYDFSPPAIPASVWEEFAGGPLFVYGFGTGGYHGISAVDVGTGYWLGILNTGPDGRWDAADLGGVEVSGDYARTYSNAGWHLIGEPFRQASSLWSDAKFRPVGRLEWSDFDPDTLLPVMYGWTGGAYLPQTRMAPYLGYWVGIAYPNIDIQLEMAADNQNAVPEPEKPSASSWRLPLVAEVMNPTPALRGERLPGMVMRDEVAALGVVKGATRAYDVAFDMPQPPVPMGDYIRVYFDRPEWSPVFGREYATDIRKAFRSGTEAWDFNVRTTVMGERVTLSWPALPTMLPEGACCTLVDLDGGSVVNMRGVESFSYTSGAGERHFQVTIEVGSSL
jgi:hypothetical protein